MQVVATLALLLLMQAPPGDSRVGQEGSPDSKRPEVPSKEARAESPAGEETTLLEAVRRLRDVSLDELWPRVAALKDTWRTGELPPLTTLAEELPRLGEKERLAGASVLLARSEDSLSGRGQVLLQQLARTAADKGVRVAALRLLREPVQSLWEEAFFVLKGIVDSDKDPEILIEASLSLWELENYPPFLEPLKDLLESGDESIRARAALALAETGYVQRPVDGILQRLRREPSDRGRRADLLLRLLAEEKERATSSGARPPPSNGSGRPPGGSGTRVDPETVSGRPLRTWTLVVEEIVQTILDHSLQRNRLRLNELYVEALKGMVSSLDEYSSFQDPEDVEQTEAGRLGIHRGLGAQMMKFERSGPLVVVRSHYGGPAYAAGLRCGDRILELNGVPTSGQSLDRIQRLAAGAAGTELHLWVQHWNEDEPCWISVERGEVEIPTIRGELLPENLGYIRVRRFGVDTAEQIEKLLDGFEKEGLNALLLDLRGNPGGKLEEAVKVVDFFVGEREQPIVTEVGPAGRKESFPGPDQKPFHPLFLLVNRGTASSAEVIAAALQDFERATIIGQPTYGKGVRQTSLPVSPRLNRLLGGEGRLLLTTAYLYSPRGRPLQAERGENGGSLPGKEGGVKPDIRVGELEERVGTRFALERARVQFDPVVNRFLRDRYSEIRSLFEEEGKVWNPASDPDFEALVRSLMNTRLRLPQIRRAIQAAVRRHLEDDRGREFVGDIQDDVTLQRAVLESLRRLGRNPLEIPAYRFLLERTGT